MEIYFSPDIGEVFDRYSNPGIGEVLKLNLFRLEMGNMLETFSAGGCTPRSHLKVSMQTF
jgi:hypothetical protein